MIYFTSDWHLCETSARLSILNRPRHYTDSWFLNKLSDNCRYVVDSDNDGLYILGDLFCRNAYEQIDEYRFCTEKLPLLFSKFNKVTLLRGNHDRNYSDAFFKRLGIAEIFEEGISINLVLDCKLNVSLNHYPRLSTPDAFNLVGHIHSSWRVQKNMLNVGVDANHYCLLSEDDVVKSYNSICNYYDDDVWVHNHMANTLHEKRGKSGSYFNFDSNIKNC